MDGAREAEPLAGLVGFAIAIVVLTIVLCQGPLYHDDAKCGGDSVGLIRFLGVVDVQQLAVVSVPT